MSWLRDLVVAFQFLTRLPMPSMACDSDALPRATRFFPLVGLVIGLAAALLHSVVQPHLGAGLTAVAVLIFLVMCTGALHEDGLADTADGLGGGRTRERALEIMRDSRIGSYGAIALVLSLLARFFVLLQLPSDHFLAVVVSAHVLSRWTTLPLGFLLPSARVTGGQGVRVAKMISTPSLVVATIFAVVTVCGLQHWKAAAPFVATLTVTAASGRYYRHRLGGLTGDCFGATNQLTEIAVYICGVWH